ncbi:MAG: hypothetical protein LIO96_09045 [Lachnospiraceae bacterium]|nr:hypothetical protein [Lachnospiraceae bacterium]
MKGTVNLILADGYTLTAVKGGISVTEGQTLNIYGQSEGTGKVDADGKYSEGAGIGSGTKETYGTITINGGTVNATGGRNGAAGIGGGFEGGDGTVIINGGTVTATGNGQSTNYAIGVGGAGIGGGNKKDSANSIIHICTQTAKGGDGKWSKNGYYYGGVGIGGGRHKDYDVTITGGTVTATGGGISGYPYGGVGIGGHNGSILISGGTVTATGAGLGAGIGSDEDGSGTITIQGGTVTANGGVTGIGGGTSATINISGGYVLASGSSREFGLVNNNPADITITGGYFGSGTAGKSGTGQVYSHDVASGYTVYDNTDEKTGSIYPVYVAKTKSAIGLSTTAGTLNEAETTTEQASETVDEEVTASASAEDTSAGTIKSSAASNSSVVTGDNTSLWLWAALLAISGLGISGATVYRRKKHR